MHPVAHRMLQLVKFLLATEWLRKELAKSSCFLRVFPFWVREGKGLAALF